MDIKEGKIHTIHLLTLAALLLGMSACDVQQMVSSSVPSGNVLFQDDFSDQSSGWLQGRDDIGLTEYSEGGFRIYVASETSAKVSIPRLQFTDVRIQVEAKKIGGPDDNDFGVVCRYKDQNNFYFFTISSDGYYGIGKYRENELILIGMEQMQTTDYIHQGANNNQLRADCIGNTLAFYINGNLVGEVQDSDFTSGDVGLIAGTFKTQGTDILFDNFSVLKP